MTRAGWVVSALAVIATTAAAALVAARLYIGWQMPLLLAASAAGAVTLTLLLRWLSGSPVLAVLGSLAGLGAVLVATGAALANRAVNQGPLPAVLMDSYLNSGARLMTASIPIEPAPDTVALPVVLTWLTGTAGVLLARWPLPTLLPPVGLLGAALVFVGPNAAPAYPLVGIFTVAAAAHLVATRDGGVTSAALSALPPGVRRTEVARRWGTGLAAVAVLGLLAVTAGPAAAALYRDQPHDPRALFVPPQRRSEALNPLGMLSAWATERDLPLLEVRSDRPVRTSWVAMSRFDGITWLPDDEFRVAGSVLPEVTPAPARSRPVTQDVVVRDLGGSWLPAATLPREVRGLRAGFDTRSGMLAAPDGLTSGLRYTVVSQVPVRDPAMLVAAGLPVGPEYDHLYALPGQAPDGFVELARKAAGQGTAYQKALRLEKFLRETYRFAPDAPSGHGYPNLSFFLTESKADGGGRGTSEQFATAFAVLGRMVGLPTRVVVGFHAGQRTGAGEYLVRTGDAFAWAEVHLLGEGWVPFDPTPGQKGAAPPPEEDTPEAEAESASKEQELSRPDPTPPADDPELAAPDREPEPGRIADGWALAAVAAGVALLVPLFAVPVLRSRRSRLRLARGSPAQRVVGAWAEVREALRLAGRPVPASRAVAEVATVHSGEGLPDLRPLAVQVNAVGFGPPGVPDAAAAVSLARSYTRALRRTRHPVRRVLWWLDPRPLFWHR